LNHGCPRLPIRAPLAPYPPSPVRAPVPRSRQEAQPCTPLGRALHLGFALGRERMIRREGMRSNNQGFASFQRGRRGAERTKGGRRWRS
jgi:hypothetical protein